MFGPFHPFWIRKPVPVIPSIPFPTSMHHHPSAAHPQMAHHQNFNPNCVPFSLINFRGSNHSVMQSSDLDDRKVTVHKKEYFDSATIESIKNELFSANNSVAKNNSEHGAESSVYSQSTALRANSYEEDDFNNDNIDVETDSDNDQHASELKSINYQNLSDSAIKSEEWNKIMKNTMMLKSNHIEHLIATASDSNSPLTTFLHSDANQNNVEERVIANDYKIESDVELSGTKDSKKSLFPTDDEDNEFFSDSFTENNLLNLSEKKKGKYGNTKGFSIENLIGRIVEDR